MTGAGQTLDRRERPNSIEDATKGPVVVSGYDLSQISLATRDKALTDFTNFMGAVVADKTTVAPRTIRTETATENKGASIADKAAQARLDARAEILASDLTGPEKDRLAQQTAAQADYTSRADGSQAQITKGRVLDTPQVVVEETGIRQIQRVPLRLRHAQEQAEADISPLFTTQPEGIFHTPDLHSIDLELNELIGTLSTQLAEATAGPLDNHLSVNQLIPEPAEALSQDMISVSYTPERDNRLKITKRPSGHTTVIGQMRQLA